MFDTSRVEGLPVAGIPVDEDCFDPAWLDEAAWRSAAAGPPEPALPPVSACAPSGWLALELDQGCADPTALSDGELIDAVIGFDRVASWALARQAVLLAEFARRRPEDHPLAANSDTPSRCSEFAPDEVALALRLSRMTATGRLMMAQTLVEELPGTLAAWEAGAIDSLKARAITETSYLLPAKQRSALEARVLPRAGTQTIAQLRAALTRVVLALDPEGADARHQQRRQDRRVVVSPDEEGMASLWALLSAPDATVAYQRLCDLARGLGSEDARGMDARRADLLVELLTGRRCAATGSCIDKQCPGDCGCTGDSCPDDATGTTSTGTTLGPVPDPDPADRATPTNAPGPGDYGCTLNHATGLGRPLVSVIVPITMLLGLNEEPGELVGHGPIPAEQAREIAAQGTWRRLLTDPVSGALLDYGRTTYTPPAGLADFVRARDLRCRFPTCGQPAATADLDHAIPYPDGATREDNLHASCRHHHRLKTHAPGWDVEQHPDGRITWTTPTGRTDTSHPHDYRPDSHPPPGDDPPPF
ncbi:MAG TPA: DUF222 domain-containing protein [Pseudonocardiaceae bacterium]|nr:DUF222 domain-containing protein [Pseudonocardiaceae bacterium]